MKFVIALVVIIGILAFVLHRRGSSGISQNGSTDSVEGALGQQAHRHGPGSGLGGGSI
jgi:hypothetical protein